MNFFGKNVLVCGFAKSGINASLLLKKLGANVCLQDIKTEEEIKKNIPKEFNVLKDNNISFVFGKNPSYQLIDKQDLLIVSPGLSLDLDFIKYAQNKIFVWSEIELAFQNCKGTIIAITGTNGKTTTSYLTYEILKNYKSNTKIAGNVGISFSEQVFDIKEDDFVVLETSSFQLETIYKFKPKISAVLNITPDHLDRHKTLERYIKAKERIFKNQTKEDFLILNFDDEHCIKMAEKADANVVWFSVNKIIENGAYLKNNKIYINYKNINEEVININDMQILGIHNVQNAMVSILVSLILDVPINIIKKTVQNFKAVEHRIEYVNTINNVDYYNDSKGTNVDASIKAINSMRKPIVLIVGGYDKNANFETFIKSFNKKVKKLIVIGQVTEKIIDECKKQHFSNYIKANSMQQAVELSFKYSNDGDCVLLSPACASWDMFKNFEERGNIFKKYVNNLRDVKA